MGFQGEIDCKLQDSAFDTNSLWSEPKLYTLQFRRHLGTISLRVRFNIEMKVYKDYIQLHIILF